MIETLTTLFSEFQLYSKSNPVVAGVVGLWGLAVVTYFCKTIPLKITNLVKKHLTTNMHITSSHEAFHQFMKWSEKHKLVNKIRSIKISNGRFGGTGTAMKAIGYGTHWIFYKKQLIQISLSKETSTDSYDKETLTITKMGRSYKLFDKIIDEFKVVNKKENVTKIYNYGSNYWNYINDQISLNLNSICIEKEKMELLKNSISDFLNNEEIYIELGIPYRMGILLHGPPGTGKTSLIKGIADYLKKDIYILPTSNIGSLNNAISTLPSKSLITIEDVDSASSTKKRRKESKPNENEVVCSETSESKSVTDDFLENWMGDISSLLNSIDGITDSHGRILIMTTNHIDKLDTALLRPGRVDLTIEIGNVSEETLGMLFKKFFPDYILPTNFRLVKELSPAKFQQMFLLKKQPNEIFAEYTICEQCKLLKQL